MADDEQLAEAIITLIAASQEPARVSLMNHDANQAAVVIGAVVERCPKAGVLLADISVDTDLASALGLTDSAVLPHGDHPRVRVVSGLRRDVLFRRG
jgi:hypothetical protein